MKLVAWIRASQAILFEASIVPAIVGTAAAVHAGARFNAVWFGLIVVSLVGIQAGANLFKGFYEGRDRSVPPSSAGSWFAFDSAAATNLTAHPGDVLRIGRVCFAIGVAAGLLLVVLTSNAILFAFGIAGAILAWSYSSPPMQLSYRGIGEISTFLAFGPVMTLGATVAFGGAGLVESALASVVLGFLAAAISFARYFPNREEDASKGKRTPVTIFGFEKARRIFFGLLLAPLLFGILWYAFGGGILWIGLLLGASIAIVRTFPTQEKGARFDGVIAATIAAHIVVGLAIVVDLAMGL
jgi:1,4-dihydroxy-2-naphthoate octaprenyltransferase